VRAILCNKIIDVGPNLWDLNVTGPFFDTECRYVFILMLLL